jgi:hypothetical protein
MSAFYKRVDMIETIEQSGAQRESLSLQSPDLNTIEKMARAKAVRKRERSDVDTLLSIT